LLLFQRYYGKNPSGRPALLSPLSAVLGVQNIFKLQGNAGMIQAVPAKRLIIGRICRFTLNDLIMKGCGSNQQDQE
jgi:hypothetical protein